MSDFTAPSPVIRGLEAIEHDLAVRQNGYELAAGMRARLVRDWEKRLAEERLKAEGSDAEARKAAALIAAINRDDLFAKVKDAEANFEGHRAAVKVLETRATIGQSILRAQGRA